MREIKGVGSSSPGWRPLFESGTVAGLDDGPLLDRFADQPGDAAELAFAALVARHGPMVRRVCRDLLIDPNDADDAFQATFLVLARKARTIRQPDRLANWLYGTAHRASRRLRADLARRRRHEAARLGPTPPRGDDRDRSEEAAIVLEEVARLPKEERVAVVLCDLEGLTQDEAARRLGCSDRTLRRRLARAHDLLRDRLGRRGIAPPSAVLALGSIPIPAPLIASTARLALRFASPSTTAGIVPTSALTLANGVIAAMTSTYWKGIAALVVGLLALGGGIGASSAWMPRPAIAPGSPPQKPEGPAVAAAVAAPQPSPLDQYKALVKKYDDLLKVYQAAMIDAKTEAEQTALAMKLSPFARDHAPAFVALAEAYPKDPVAMDALIWAADAGLSAIYQPDHPGGRAFARTLEILARDHADDPRLGTYCPKLSLAPDSIKGDFLRAIAARSRNRVVQGRATLTLAEYLRREAALAELFQATGPAIKFDPLFQDDMTADDRRAMEADPAAFRRRVEDFYVKFQPDYLKTLKRADAAALRLESKRAYDRVAAEFADVPAVAPFGKPTRETLADLARKHHSPRPPVSPAPPASRSAPLAEAYKVALRKTNEVSSAAGQGMPGVKAYIASAPKWSDYGPKMMAIAEESPRSPDAFDALLWVVGHPMPFFDSAEERTLAIGRAVDLLIADHLEFLGDHLDDREVAEGFNHWSPVPAPQVDRIFQTLSERGRTREIRGRMALMLARHRKAEADLVESLDVRGADPARRPELALFAPSYLEPLRRTGHRRLGESAAAILEKMKADYGDLPYVSGPSPTGETLAVVADRELADLRTLAVGQVAPEINGPDVQGKPMALSEFRGKVVLLDFGTHEHCGGCKLVYPKQRELVEAYKARPFAILGINTGDRLATLKEIAAQGDVTWRCWWDGDDALHPGPITTRWNIRGYPTFIVLDHQGVIRFKDLHPFDPTFARSIEILVKEAEAALP